MKKPISQVNEDIDAGWDDIASKTISVTAKPIESQPPEVGELDAGWDTEDLKGESPSAQRKSTKGARAASKKRTPPVTPSTVSLTKKARRELERQNKIHDVKRRAEAKAKRKAQRRAEVTRNGEVPSLTIDSDSKKPRADEPARPSRVKKKSRRLQVDPRKHQTPSNRARVVEDRNIQEQVSRKGDSSSAAPDPSATSAERSRIRTRPTKAWLFIVLFLIALVVVAARWLR